MVITKEFLASLEPSIPECLPIGAIKALAQKHGLNEKSVGQMLRGRYGEEENLMALYTSAIEMMQENIELIEQQRNEWMASQRVVAAGRDK